MQGLNPREVVRSDEVKLLLSAWQPLVCDGRTIKSGKMDFEWRELTGRFAQAGGTLTTINPRSLTIPPDILVPLHTYKFEAFAAMRANPSMNTSAGVTVYVARQSVIAKIADGDAREVGADAWLRWTRRHHSTRTVRIQPSIIHGRVSTRQRQHSRRASMRVALYCPTQ